MPVIYCTSKLSKLLDVKNKVVSNSTNNWNAHLFFLAGKKCIVFIHKNCFYSFVLFEVVKKDLVNLKHLFESELIAQLKSDKIYSDEMRSALLKDIDHLELSTTDGDKKVIGFMNDCIIRIKYVYYGSLNMDMVKQYVHKHCNDTPIAQMKYSNSKELLMAESIK